MNVEGLRVNDSFVDRRQVTTACVWLELLRLCGLIKGRRPQCSLNCCRNMLSSCSTVLKTDDEMRWEFDPHLSNCCSSHLRWRHGQVEIEMVHGSWSGLFNMGIPHVTHIKLLWGNQLNMVSICYTLKINQK